jgi:hypothetical protein
MVYTSLRLRCGREEAMARYGRWLGLAEVEPPRLVRERDSLELALKDGEWRGFVAFVFVYGPWTVFELLASGLSGRSVESWLELARNDDLVYVDCNDAAQYAEVLAMSQGRLVRHFLQENQDSSGHVNIGTLPEEGRERFDDWVDVVAWAETDSDTILRPSHGWLWIHEANWLDARSGSD